MSSQDPVPPTVQQIADALRVANEEGGLALVDALARFAADRVVVRHHPPRRHADGVFSGSEWIEFERSVVEKVATSSAEMRSEDRTVRADGDTIVMEEVLIGEGPDGTAFRVPAKMVLPVRDGRILGYDAYYDPTTTPSFMADTEAAVREGR